MIFPSFFYIFAKEKKYKYGQNDAENKGLKVKKEI